MSRKHYSLSKQVVAAAALALGASGVALADDSSMNPFTGDSYAYFNGGQNVGNFNNVARALRMQAPDATTGRPNKDEQKAEEKIMLATPKLAITPPRLFNDNTGA